MTRAGQAAPEPDLIDRIANALPTEVRADYYRELRHCRSLPENDEMLRILRAMQFLTLLTEQVPNRIVAQREMLDRRLRETTDSIDRFLKANEAYHRHLEERLAELPFALANEIRPEAIAAAINENLRQQFIVSTIPQTAESLSAVAREIKKVTAEFRRTAKELGDSYAGAAEEARRAVQDIESSVSCATDAAKRATDNLSWTFKQAYRWLLGTLCGISLLLGIGLGVLGERWIESPKDQTDVSSPAPPRLLPKELPTPKR